MKAVLLKTSGGMEVADVPTPPLHQGDILVELKVCGLCGSDIEKLQGEYTAAPPVLGHEAAGIVAKITNSVAGIEEGDRVFPHHHVPCYKCYFCTHGSPTMCHHYRRSNLDPGGFAEFFRVPAWNIQHGGVLELPDSMSFEEASFIEPTACCIRALDRCGVEKDTTALIVGAGPIGLTILLLLPLRGVKRIFVSDISPNRLSFARKLGTEVTFDASQEDISGGARALTDGQGVDLALVASGNPKAITQALTAVRKGGKVCLVGVPFAGSILEYDSSNLVNNEISLIPSNAATETETKRALDLIALRRIDVSSLVTHTFRLAEFEKAVETAKRAESVKVLIQP